MNEIPRPIRLPVATILQMSRRNAELLAQAIGSLDTGIEFVDLLDPLYDATRTMFFDFGRVDCITDIRDPGTRLPGTFEDSTVLDWVEILRMSMRDIFGRGALAALAIVRLDADPVLVDRILFLGVSLPEEVTAIAAHFGITNCLLIKENLSGYRPEGMKILHLASVDPVEQMAQLRSELGDLS